MIVQISCDWFGSIIHGGTSEQNIRDDDGNISGNIIGNLLRICDSLPLTGISCGNLHMYNDIYVNK